jgi:type I restriction enzyme S subunit
MVIDSLFGDLPPNWETTTLGDICNRGGGLVQTGPFGSQLHAADYVPVGIPSIMPQNIGENRVVPDGIARITERDAKRLSRYLVRNGDIVYSRRGDVERRALITEKEDGWLCGTGCLRVRFGSFDYVDPLYASFYLGDMAVRAWIVQHAIGATMPNLNTSILSALPIVLPPLPEQRAIAGILGVLDDKIEVNRRMNVTLESMARAVFRQWFVESEEVGNWEVGKIGDIADVIDCLHSKKPERQETGMPFLQLANILDNGLLDMTDTYYITKTDYEYWVSRIEASVGDCVITNVGRVGAVAQIPEGVKAALGRNMTAVRLKKEFPYPTFLIECLLSDSMRQEINNKTDSGTILNALNVKNIPLLQFPLPPHDLLKEFELLARPIRAKMEANLKESHTLGSLRDSLLPKLMRREVRVKDVG